MAFLQAARDNNVQEVDRLLLDSNSVADLLKACTQAEEFTALHIAASAGYNEIVVKLLAAIRDLRFPDDEVKSLMNCRDYINRAPLHHAAVMKHESVMETLLSYPEVDVNAQDRDGMTPLHILLDKLEGNFNVLRPLLGHSQIDVNQSAVQSQETKAILTTKNMPDHLSQRNSSDPISPLKIIVPEDLESKDSLTLLGAIWEFGYQRLDEQIVKAIEKQLKADMESSNSVKSIEKADTETNSVMHLAAFLGRTELTKILVRRPSTQVDINALNSEERTPLHLAALTGKLEVVRVLHEQEKLWGAVEDEYGQTAVEIAFEVKWDRIVRLLMMRQDVKDYVGMEHADRSVYVDGTNAILVGASLIASITFGGLLSPPLGYQPYFQFPRLSNIPGAPPDQYQQFAAVSEYTSVKVFWVANSLSFYFSIAAILSGAATIVPRTDLFIRSEVRRLKAALFLTSWAFSWAIVFVVVAFTAAGFASLPPIFKYQLYMIVIVVVGVVIIYLAFAYARISNPKIVIDISRYIDPAFYFQRSVDCLFNDCNRKLFGYHSARARIRQRKLHYNPETKSRCSKCDCFTAGASQVTEAQ